MREAAAAGLERLRQVLGREAASPGDEVAGFKLGATADVVAFPTDERQAVELMRLARSERWRVRPAGAGTWSALAARDEVVVVASTARMARVLEYVPADPLACVEAGVRLTQVAELAAARRQWLALDPVAAEEATVGAAIALGAAGPLRQGFGTAREHVLGLTLVTPDARVLSFGGRVLKNVAGYDMTRLTIGSRGALGLVTRVNLRLRPLPEADATLALGFASLAAAALAARRICARPQAVAVELLSEGLAARVAPAAKGYTVLVRLQGEREAVEGARAFLLELSSGDGATHVEPPLGAWTALRDAELATKVTARLTARPADLAQTLQHGLDLAATEAANVAAHCGEGIVRVLLDDPRTRGPDWPARVAALRARGVGVVLEPAGSPLLGGVAAFEAAPANASLSQRLKRVFDPEQVLSDEAAGF